MKKEKEITIDKIHQAGFDRENFVTSSPKKKFLFPQVFSLMKKIGNFASTFFSKKW